MNNTKRQDEKFCRCLYYTSTAFAREMTIIAEEEFSVVGLAPSYAFLLMVINEKPGIQPKNIAETMQLSQSTITRLIEKLELKNFAIRRTEGKNTKVTPTEKSLLLQPELDAAWLKIYNRYTEILGNDYSTNLTSQIYDSLIKLGNHQAGQPA